MAGVEIQNTSGESGKFNYNYTSMISLPNKLLGIEIPQADACQQASCFIVFFSAKTVISIFNVAGLRSVNDESLRCTNTGAGAKIMWATCYEA